MEEKEKKENLRDIFENFDWSVLFREEEEGFSKFLPFLILILQIITLILVWRK